MKKQKVPVKILAVAGLFIVLSAFSVISKKETRKMGNMMVTKAVCVLHPTEGNNVTGVVTFTKTDKGMHVVADVHGLAPGKHGFHIHQYGDCTAADGTSTGGHFNPDNMKHGGPMDKVRHEGDMGNIEADAKGDAHLDYVDPMLSFEGEHSIIGRGIIVHAGEDDLKSQPTGAAGARVACGVIGIAKGE